MDSQEINLVQTAINYFQEIKIPFAILDSKKKEYEICVYINQKKHYLSISKKNCVDWKSLLSHSVDNQIEVELMKIGHIVQNEENQFGFRHRAFMDGDETMKNWLSTIYAVIKNI